MKNKLLAASLAATLALTSTHALPLQAANAAAAAPEAASSSAESKSVNHWVEANERVQEAGGWKAYAREINAAKKAASSENDPAKAKRPTLTLEAALQRAQLLDPSIAQALGNAPRELIAYPTLSDAQRAALGREARLRAEVQSLYFSAVAANERLRYQLQVVEAASVASELASRMQKVGNLNRLHQSEEALSLAETERSLSSARTQAQAATEQLIQRLQLSGEQASFSLPERLPPLPAASAPPAISKVDSLLIASPVNGPAQIKAQSEARQALHARDEAFRLAAHYRDTVLPLQKQISEEHLLHYNGMIIGIFELLKDAKKQVHAVQSTMEALRAYWLAEAALAPKLFALREELLTSRRDAWK